MLIASVRLDKIRPTVDKNRALSAGNKTSYKLIMDLLLALGETLSTHSPDTVRLPLGCCLEQLICTLAYC